MIFPILLVIFSWKSSISVQSTLPPRVKPKQTLCRESESSVFYTDNPSEKILRCGGGFRTFIFNTKTSSFSYSDYTLKSLYRLWLGECNKIWKSTDYITDIIILVCCSLSLFTHGAWLAVKGLVSWTPFSWAMGTQRQTECAPYRRTEGCFPYNQTNEWARMERSAWNWN